MRSLVRSILFSVSVSALTACHSKAGETKTVASASPESALIPSAIPIPSTYSTMAQKQPYADMSATLGTVTTVPIRGRIVYEREKPNSATTTPLHQASQEELKGVDFEAILRSMDGQEIVKLGEARNDQEGYIDVAFPLKEGAARPGHYIVEVRMANGLVGQTTARLLANDYQGSVVRSDIDLTYLDTHFHHKRDMIKLLTQNASERRTLPGMDKVYSALRGGASGNDDRPLIFISGSPRFFKRTLEAKMDLDGVKQNGVFLKAFEEIAFTQVINLDPEKIVPALKEQVGYKLGHLLRGRLELPTKASEILLGDDSEGDFAVYSIYTRLMNGELDGDGAHKELIRGGVDPNQTSEIVTLAAKVRETLGGFHPVKVIYINQTGAPNERMRVQDWRIPGLLREHQGAWPLVLDMYEEGLVSKESVAAVKAKLIELGATPAALDDLAKSAVKSGLLDAKSTSL